MTPEEQAPYGVVINACENAGHERAVGLPCSRCIAAALAERDCEIAALTAKRDALVEALDGAVEHCAQIVERSEYLPGCKPICDHGFPVDCLAAAIRALKDHYAARAAGKEER